MGKSVKRLLAVILAAVLAYGGVAALGGVPAAAADIPAGYSAISTPQELSDIRNNLSGKYILTADIDLADWGDWEPIGYGYSYFSGIFDGDGYVVTNLTISIDNAAIGDVGLFGYVQNGVLRNINLLNGSVMVSADYPISVGGIVGCAVASTISNCANRNTSIDALSTSATSLSYVGGVVGEARGEETNITQCFNAGSVASSYVVGGHTGGVAGYAVGLSMSDCYNIGAVSSSPSVSNTRLGGIGGLISDVVLTNCYNTGSVNGTGIIGGIAGGAIGDSRASASNCYSLDTTADEVFGGANIRVTNVICLDDTHMRQQASFVGFDFDEVWDIASDKNEGYPFLRGMTVPEGSTGGEIDGDKLDVDHWNFGNFRTPITEDYYRGVFGEKMELKFLLMAQKEQKDIVLGWQPRQPQFLQISQQSKHLPQTVS